jgi:prephenate dehydrogenase
MDARSVGIVGVGLIGGSIAIDALRSGYQVCLYDRSGADRLTGDGFRNARIVDDLKDIAAESRMIILATPISAIAGIIGRLVPFLRSEHIVSDVASVKGPAVSTIREAIGNKCDYIPVHPMAGSEKSGLGAARPDLFSGAVTLLCSEFVRDTANMRFVMDFWKDLGTKVFATSVEKHDEMVAAMSHLPHLIAALLVIHVAESDVAALDLCGSGFRDLTRIASGEPELWADILVSNATALAEHLCAFRDLIERTLPLLAGGDGKKLQGLLDVAKQNRDRLTR